MAMNSLVTLVLLCQIIGCTFSVVLLKESDYNGEEAKKFGDLAVHYINQHNLHGYKQTLNPYVEKVVSVELDVLETECHVLDPTPVENCTVRQQDHHAVKSECVVRIHRENGDKVSGANCHSKPGNRNRSCPVQEMKVQENYRIYLSISRPEYKPRHLI